MKRCPCDSQMIYQNCCGRFIEQGLIADTPLELMRSRYTAYTQENFLYIKATMKSPAADTFNLERAYSTKGIIHWTMLKVLSSSIQDKEGFIEFIAEYMMNNHKVKIHEVSEFNLINGQWFYVDGKFKSQ